MPNAGPVYLNCDVPVGLNNRLPSDHVPLIASLVLREGEHVVQARGRVITPPRQHTGRVTAIEFDPALAQRAKQHFSATVNVPVLQGGGAQLPFDPVDAIISMLGVTRPADNWLARLNDGGRLICPDLRRRQFGRPITSAVERSIKSTVPKNMLSNDGLRFYPCCRWMSTARLPGDNLMRSLNAGDAGMDALRA
jgi:hypothetical protein